MMARAVPEGTAVLLGLERQTGTGGRWRERGQPFPRAARSFRPPPGSSTFGGFEERTAAGIKHLRRLQSRRVRGAQAKRLSSPARCCSQGVRTRQGISRIHHRCFGSVAASLESRASLLQVSRNSVDQEQNERFSFQVSRDCADQEHLDRDLPGKRALAWKVPRKKAGPSGKMAPSMEGPWEKRRTFQGNGLWHGRSRGKTQGNPGKRQDLPGKWLLAWKVPLKNARKPWGTAGISGGRQK